MQRPPEIHSFLQNALAEDIGTGDATATSIIPADLQARLVMRAREKLVLAGACYLQEICDLVGPGVAVALHKADGDAVGQGEAIATLEGPARLLLTAERTALNLIQQLSGVATLTAEYVAAIAGTGAKLLDTRKTIPGMRQLQKYAVRCGGGHNHRMGLWDAVLIKDNHIAIAGSLTRAVEAARTSGTPIQVECDTLAQVAEAIAARADLLLLDNMDNDTLRAAVALAKPAAIATEASGNVSLASIRAIAQTGVDRISVGRITHSARAVDIGLDEA
jgi:nicotinate-nucleotide pyrophosphorylase (carboxylating)